MIRKLLILAEDGLLRIAGILNHIVSVLIFNAAVNDGGKQPILQLKLDGNLLNSPVVVKAPVDSVGINGFLPRRSACKKEGQRENQSKQSAFHPAFLQILH